MVVPFPRAELMRRGAACGGEPVGHALQAGAMAGRRGVEAGPVVSHGELDMAARARQGYGCPGRAGVFRGVLQGFQDAEVHGGLGVSRVAADAVCLDQHGQRSPAGLRTQGWPQALIGKQRRVDLAGQARRSSRAACSPARSWPVTCLTSPESPAESSSGLS
jgi:hypothetical protein